MPHIRGQIRIIPAVTSIVWFRQDLRLADNPALCRAASQGPVVPVYILEPDTEEHLNSAQSAGRAWGGASRWWLHRSLDALSRELGGLLLRRGEASVVLAELLQECDADAVYWNRCYEPAAIARDTALKAALSNEGIGVESFNASLLHEPWQVRTLDGGPFKVYSAFWRACLKRPVSLPLSAPRLRLTPVVDLPGDALADWNLLPKRPNWAAAFEEQWLPGEQGAQRRLNEFLKSGLRGYATLRDRADLPNVSRLSPHLHWGEISPRQIWAATHNRVLHEGASSGDASKFLAEVGWREFAYHLLYHYPTLTTENWRRAFDAYPWTQDESMLRAWQRGRTGYPLVDAGMRELWNTGYMHNRVRMVAASFLIKHLRIDWRLGEAWFWDTLVDADLANNCTSWQWVAGSGADAAPYFRIFNPMEQGRKFDPEGNYVRRWCPELARLPTIWLHAPFEAPAEILVEAGVTLGRNYPRPIVEHSIARLAALAGFEAVRAQGAAPPKNRTPPAGR